MESHQYREKLLHGLHETLREVSSATIMYHQAIADYLGLNSTDHKCLDMIRGLQSVTAGQLSEFTGLTTGSITAVIDRLERRGLVSREKGPNDRRQVVVIPVVSELERTIGPLFHSLHRAMTKMLSTYTNEEVTLINEFAGRNAQLLREETSKMKLMNSET